MSTYIITRSTSVNQVDSMGTPGAPLSPLTGLIPALEPETGLNGSASWTPGTVASMAVATTTVTVNGSRAGDRVSIVTTPALPSGVTAFGYVSAAGIVTVTAQNQTAGSLTLTAVAVKVTVLPQNQVERGNQTS